MKKLIILIIVLAFVLIGGVSAGAYYFYELQNYVTTDDAKVQGDLMSIGSAAAGKLVSWTPNVGDTVQKGATIGRVETLPARPDAAPGTIDIVAPADGTVIDSKAVKDQIVAPGMPLAMTTDLNKLYVTANFTETDINDIKPGQNVTITIDAFPDTTFDGTVERIGLATNSALSLFPSSNTSGNYTKVVQRIPVLISFNSMEGKKLIPGLNAYVKIEK